MVLVVHTKTAWYEGSERTGSLTEECTLDEVRCAVVKSLQSMIIQGMATGKLITPVKYYHYDLD